MDRRPLAAGVRKLFRGGCVARFAGGWLGSDVTRVVCLLSLLAIAAAFAAEIGPSLEGNLVVASPEPAQDVADTGAFGGCSAQALHGGEQLPELPYFYSRIAPGSSYGSTTMIDLLVDAGRHMSWAMPKASPFAVGDISRPAGGPLSGHRSHRGGIDADVGIYKTGGFQAQRQFVGVAPSELDIAATWELMRFMLDSGKVEFILLDRAHIATIKAWTLKQGLLSEDDVARIFPVEGSRDSWLRTGIVRHAPHHGDHMHVRVLCGDGTRASL